MACLPRELIGNMTYGWAVLLTSVARGRLRGAMTVWRIHAVAGSAVSRNVASGSRHFGPGTRQNVGSWSAVLRPPAGRYVGPATHWTSSTMLAVIVRRLLVEVVQNWRWRLTTVIHSSRRSHLIHRPRGSRGLPATSHNQQTPCLYCCYYMTSINHSTFVLWSAQHNSISLKGHTRNIWDTGSKC